MASTTGSCLCGAVRVTLPAPPTQMEACHCGMCRKHGGGPGLGVAVPRAGLVWSGESRIGVYPSSDWAERGFCKTCGSSLFWRMRDPVGPGGDTISLAAGLLDDMNGLPLATEVFIDSKPDGYAFAGDAVKMTEAEAIAAFTGAGAA